MCLNKSYEVGFLEHLLESRNFGILFVCGVLLVLIFLLYRYFNKFSETTADIEARFSQLDKIVDEQKLLTKATEEIKIELSHADWSRKEYLTLKRTKLEDLVLAIEAVAFDLRKICNSLLNLEVEFEPADYPFASKVQMLASLYFPEVTDKSDEFQAAYSTLVISVVDNHHKLWRINQELTYINMQMKLHEKNIDLSESTVNIDKLVGQQTLKQEELTAASKELTDKIMILYTACLDLRVQLLRKSLSLMPQIMSGKISEST